MLEVLTRVIDVPIEGELWSSASVKTLLSVVITSEYTLDGFQPEDISLLVLNRDGMHSAPTQHTIHMTTPIVTELFFIFVTKVNFILKYNTKKSNAFKNRKRRAKVQQKIKNRVVNRKNCVSFSKKVTKNTKRHNNF